jgi:PAS domain S-box-containing protein
VRSITEDPYEQIIQSLDLIVWESDVESCRFTFVSDEAERLLGYPVARWLESAAFWPSIIHPEDRQWSIEYCAEQTALLRGHQFEYRVLSADGRIVWLRDIVSVITEDGNFERNS